MTSLTLGLPLLVGTVLLVLAVGYALVVSSWAVGFRRMTSARGAGRNGRLPLVSVIVPARDEARSIRHCLDSILACDYPQDYFEIIVVDDLSEDGTPEVVRHMMREVSAASVPAGAVDGDVLVAEEAPSYLRLLQMPENLARTRAHKKRAIARGIAEARGSIILTTDADCVVGRGWIREMVGSFSTDVALVSGPVLYPTDGGPARQVQALEFLGLVAVGAGAIGTGRPNLCNGANVAYRKDVFEDVGGFSGIDHLTSGDDELLMQKIAYTTGWRVTFCASPGATVVTEGASSVGAFVQQRKRWASKGRHYPHLPLKVAIALIYAFYVMLLAAPVAMLAGALTPAALAVALALKIVPEAALLWPACRHFGRLRLMAFFLPAQLLHVPYIVAMGAAGAIGGYSWKGREISR